MRRLIILLLFAALSLAGCGGNSTSTSTTAAADLSKVEVTGAEGEKPKIELPSTPWSTGKTERKILNEGDGEQVKVGSKVEVNYLGINGKDGKEFDSSFDPAAPTTFTLAEGALIKGFVTGLEGVKIGSRVLVAIAPADGYGPAGGQPSAGIGKDDTLLFVIDVKGARDMLKRAEGTAVEQSSANPKVSLDDEGVPTVEMPKGPPPTQTATVPLINGSGAEVAAGQSVTANYLVAAWSDSRVIESSWQKGGPATLQMGGGQLLKDLEAGLTGQKVGSQVMFVVPQPNGIPAAQPSSTQSPATTPATVKPDALVFVIDILDAS